MSHINIPDKKKSQGSFDLQFFPQQGKDEDKLELTSSSTIPASRQMIKSQKIAFNQFFLALCFKRMSLLLKMMISVSNLICCL